MALSEQEIIRREKLRKLSERGIEAFPAAEYKISHSTGQIEKDFKEGSKVKIAGRLMSRRIQGKASFAELQDSTGRIQLYFNRDEICPGEDKELYNEIYKHLLDAFHHELYDQKNRNNRYCISVQVYECVLRR